MLPKNSSPIFPLTPAHHDLAEHVCTKILAWYGQNKRDLPWRFVNNDTPDPYKVWLSEIMLQQTTVATVRGYYADFVGRWATVTDLANAPRDDVLSAWAGLGYYARARNLHACAGAVRDNYGGVFPNTESELLKLPGIGAYTSAAISAIAFGNRAVVVDGNVERVVSRLFNMPIPLPTGRSVIYKLTDLCTPNVGSGDLAQGFMDLGSGICKPKNPNCGACPLSGDCLAYQAGADTVLSLPQKTPKKPKPIRTCYGYVVVAQGQVLLEQRPDTGLLGGMLGIPCSDWVDSPLPDLGVGYPLEGHFLGGHLADCDNGGDTMATVNYTVLSPTVRHTFTHFHLDIHVVHVDLGDTLPNITTPYGWYGVENLPDLPLPTVMQKPLNRVLG